MTEQERINIGITDWWFVFSIALGIFLGLATGNWEIAVALTLSIAFGLGTIGIQLHYWTYFPFWAKYMVVLGDLLFIVVIIAVILYILDLMEV